MCTQKPQYQHVKVTDSERVIWAQAIEIKETGVSLGRRSL